VRVPVVPPQGQCKPFQEVLVELASRPEAAGLHDRRRRAASSGLPRLHRQLRDRAGLGHRLPAGWRGKDGEKSLRGEPNPKQWEMYAKNNCVFHHDAARAPVHAQLEPRLPRVGAAGGPAARRDPITDPPLLEFCSASGSRRRARAGPPAARSLRERVETYFDPLPFWYAPLEVQATDTQAYPLAAVTQRPMAMYHSWDSQNAWLRQIHAHNYLFVNPRPRRPRASPTATGSGSSRLGQGALHVPLQRGRRARHGLDLERDRQGQGRLER
jgi:sulfite dehydrogenase (quinone) subunit SoeA